MGQNRTRGAHFEQRFPFCVFRQPGSEADVPGTAEWIPHKGEGKADALDSARNSALPKASIDYLAIFGCVGASTAQTEGCPSEMAMKAESEASTLKTWRAIFESYKKYKQCDDGAIAEGYSSSIATLLADHWRDIGQLTRLSNANAAFGNFVVHHVDETMSFDQATKIKKNVTQRCPSGAKKLCDEIQRQFSDAGF